MILKSDDRKKFEEIILAGDRIIKESYPLEEKKKLIVRYTLSKILWRGDEYAYATPTIDYCCESAIKRLGFYNNNIPSPGSNPANFRRMVFLGEWDTGADPINKCPFCGAEIEIEEVKS